VTPRFAGRTTLVTGAVGGIGEATCVRIAEEGGRLLVTDLDLAACTALADGLPGDGHLAMALDVADEAAWVAVAERLRADGVVLHGLVNNAGIGSGASVVDEDLETWERVVGINQTGVWLGMKHLGPLVTGEEPGGSIVNMCSMFGTSGGFGASAAYHASKGAVRTLTKSAAMHWAGSGVRVNSIHPGFVETPNLLVRHGGTERYTQMVETSPLGRLATPAEVAAAIAFLASADSTFMTGSELYVDGGFTAR
jgi:3alpha(or 20beta)-hydroxysteroid dehydrogenase